MLVDGVVKKTEGKGKVVVCLKQISRFRDTKVLEI